MLKSLKLALAVATGAATLSLAGLATGSPMAGAATNQVRQLQVSNWFAFNEGPSGSLGNVTLVPGPASPPAGTGSAKLQVDSTGRASLGSNAFKGTSLSQITAMDYWGYVVGGTTNQLVLTFDVTYDTTPGSSAYQGRLTFIPRSPPPANAWRHLNALTDGTWYGTAAPGNMHCSQSSPCTWTQVLGFFPHAAVRNDPIGQGALLLRLGGPVTGGATAYVDDLTVATGISSPRRTSRPAARSHRPSVPPARPSPPMATGSIPRRR